MRARAEGRSGPEGLPPPGSRVALPWGLGRGEAVRDRIRAWVADLRRVVGMPDYQAYVEHQRLHHPESPIPSEREFFTRYTESRYSGGPTRCC